MASDLRVILLLLFISIGSAIDGGSQVLNPDRDYTATWEIDTELSIVLRLLRTDNWFGFGISYTSTMNESDIIICGVKSDGTGAFVEDRHGIKNGFPPLDVDQDWKISRVSITDTHTTISITRPLFTNEPNMDYDIKSDRPIWILWALGSTPTLSYHGTTRGAIQMNSPTGP